MNGTSRARPAHRPYRDGQRLIGDRESHAECQSLRAADQSIGSRQRSRFARFDSTAVRTGRLRRIPDSNRSVEAGRGEPQSVCADRHAFDAAGMSPQREQQFAGTRLPNLERLIPARRCHPKSVRAERHAGDSVGVSAENSQFLTRDGVPNSDRLVAAGRSQPRSIRTEGHTPNIGHMSEPCEHLLPRSGVPHLDRVIPTRRGQPQTVRAERGAAFCMLAPAQN